ncbi:cell surface glycoprotein 1 isoform X1 [Onthophagus taurus]|uniref:cell surface glycoprotein 1 isoform X1 n=1 Tax=Onthophagus taurus TaxID=166361 RepID=UPI0039BE1CA2
MSDFAWVTLATNDSYSLGALVLAHSLKQVGTKHQMVVLITPGVTNAMREKLTTVFNIVEEVNPLDSKDEANLKLLKRPELGITFTKLHCWRLIQFQKCVFLDADTLVLSNSDELFERDEFSAAPDVGWPDCFNSGVFVYKPSNETYSKLVDFALLRGSFDGGDQGLLNLYFSDWAHKDIAKHLPFIYNMCSTAVYSYLPAFKQYGKNAKIVHFIGPAKPWLQYFNTETLKVYPSPGLQHLEETLQKWWNIFCSLIHPNLSKDMAGSKQSAEHIHSNPQTSSQTNNTHHIPNQCFNEFETLTLEDYTSNIWDPWDDHDNKQILIQHENEHIEINDSNINNYINNDINNDVNNDVNNDINNDEIVSFNLNNENYIESVETVPNCLELLDEQNYELNDDQTDKQINEDFNEIKNDIVDNFESQVSEDNREILSLKPNIPDTSDTCDTPPGTVSQELASLHVNHSNDAGIAIDSGLAGAFAQFTLGAKRTTGQDALENHLRRQAWELGNIDYLGRDSFDHIWSKICESLATPTQEASGEQKAETMVPEVVGDVPTTITTTPETCITAMKNEPTPADVLLKEIIPIPIEAIQTISAESPKPEEKSSPPQPSPADILLKEIIPVPIEAMQKQPIPKPDDSTPKSDAVAEVEALLKELIPVPIEALKTDETTPVDVTKPADLKLETAPVDVPKPDITPVDVPKPETTPVDVAKPETAPVDVPKSDIAPIDVPKPETAPVVVPKPETAPIDLPKPETAPVDLPKPETAPIDVPKPETAPIDVPKPETAPVDVPKPETAPIDVPKPEITPVDVPKSETALVDVSKTEAAPTETPKEEAPKVETAITELDVSQSVLSQALKSETTPIVAPKPESTPVEAPKDAVLQESIKTEPLPEAPKVETAPIPLEAPKTETPQEAPQPETQVTEVPKADAPKVEALKDEAPKADAPKAEIPVTETPKSESTPVEIPKETLPEKIVQQETAVSTIITPPTPTESNKIETPTMEVGPEMLSKPEVVEVPEAIPEKDRVPPPDSQKQECPMKQKECSKTEEQKSESIPPEVQPQSEIAAAKPSETTEQKPEVTEEVIKKVKVVKKKKVPKSDAPKGDAPKSDASKSDAPKSDAPKSDAPKVDTPKSDAPKSDVGATASEQQPKAGGETSTPTPPPRKTTTVKKVKAKKP